MLDAAKKYKFSFKIWVKNPLNYLYVLLSALCVMTLILSLDASEMKTIVFWGISFNLSYIFAIVIGWMSPSIIHALLKKFNKIQEKTK
jgi:hypothetical protein